MAQPLEDTPAFPLVRLTTLGTFVCERLERQEGREPIYRAMPNEEWQRRGKALTLLKVLLCQRNRRATRDALIDCLWTEEEQLDMKDVRGALKTTAVVLRDLLRVGGEDSLLITLSMSDELMVAEQQRLWVDADAFEGLVHDAVVTTDADIARSLWENAYALARGEFLADEPYSEWARTRREILRGKRGQCVAMLADIYTAQGLLDRAQELLWEAALAVPVDEDALCRLLALLEQQERYHDAWRLYKLAKYEAAKDERKLTPRVRTLAKRIHANLVEIEPYAPSSSLVLLPSATYVSERDSPSPNLLPRASGLVIPSTLFRRNSASCEPMTEDCAAWFSSRLAEVIACVTQWREKLYPLQLQALLDRELKMFDDMKSLFDADEYFLSRRSALLVIAALPKGLLSVVQQQQKASFIANEFLPSCAASITACWHLLNGSEIVSIERTLVDYLPLLSMWAHQSSPFQKTASHLAAQGYMLMGLVELHRLRFQQRVVMCQEAVKYSREADDPALLVKALTQLANAYYYQKQYNHMLLTCQEARTLLKLVPYMSQSHALAELALAYAQHGQVREALDALSQSRSAYTGEDEDAPVFLSSDGGLFVSVLFDGWVRLDLEKRYPDADHSLQAARVLSQIEALPAHVVMPERIRVEIMNRRAEAEVALGNLDAFYTYTVQGIQGAKQLGSQKRRQEIVSNYKAARQKWPHEPQLHEIADMLV